jgi:hypothetical protein
MTRATPRLAPELTPRTYGPAIGFLNKVCICSPLNDRDMPAASAVNAFGNLNLKIMVSISESVRSKNALKISAGLMLTDPSTMSSMKMKKSRMNKAKKIRLLFLLNLISSGTVANNSDFKYSDFIQFYDNR